MSDIGNTGITKQEKIVQYIAGLAIGNKISVRRIARAMEVSEGTAYRAIKEAEARGLVDTIERVGTVRIEPKPQHQLEPLTFFDVAEIVDGKVLGGNSGLDKPLRKFVIGAMELEDMIGYIEAGSLLIVGNRTSAHRAALTEGAAVLITGGFGASEEVRSLADEQDLPVITCAFDTFTVASMINRAMYDRMIKKEILLVANLLPGTGRTSAVTLKVQQNVGDWQRLVEQTGFSRFPVVDEWNRVIGMVTAKDTVGANVEQTLDKLMTRKPLTVTPRTTVTTAAHMMVWEGLELLPVIDNSRKLLGVIGRQDVLRALQNGSREASLGETMDELAMASFQEVSDENGIILRGVVAPQMSSEMGVASEGVLTTLMAQAARRLVYRQKRGDLVVENITAFYMRPVPIERTIEICPKLIEITRKFIKVEIEIRMDGKLLVKCILSAQIMEMR